MKSTLLPIVSLALILTPKLFGQTLENGDFAKGKAGWTGDGKVVYLSADGKIEEKESPKSERVMQIELKHNRWTSLKQSLHPKTKDTSVSVTLEVKAMPDFKPAAESREYSPVDFKEGGSYVWSAEVSPKCDLLVRLQDTTWYYRPLSLKPYDTWKTSTQEFPSLKSQSRSVTLAFPPGTGSVLVKSVK